MDKESGTILTAEVSGKKASANTTTMNGDTSMSVDGNSSAGLKNKENSSIADVKKPETENQEAASVLISATADASKKKVKIRGQGSIQPSLSAMTAIMRFTLPKLSDLTRLQKFIKNSSQFNTIECDGIIGVIIRYNTYHFRDDFEELRNMKFNKKKLQNLTTIVPPDRRTLVQLNNLPVKAEPELLEMLFPKAETIQINKRKCQAMMTFLASADAEQCLLENQDLVIENKQLTLDIMDFNNPLTVAITNDTAYKGDPPIRQKVFESLLHRISRPFTPYLSYDRVKGVSTSLFRKGAHTDDYPKGKLLDKLANAKLGQQQEASQQQQPETKHGKDAPAQQKKNPVIAEKKPIEKLSHSEPAQEKPPVKVSVKHQEAPKQRERLQDTGSPERQAKKRLHEDKASEQADRKKVRLESSSEKLWVCSRYSCRFKNFQFRDYCKMCRTKRTGDGRIKSPERGTRRDSASNVPWHCENLACGVSNSKDDMVCSVCALPRNLDRYPVTRGDKEMRTSGSKRPMPSLMNLDVDSKYAKSNPPTKTATAPQHRGPVREEVTDTEVIAMKIAAKHIPNIIGDRGEIRALIQQESNCLLTFPDMDEPGLDTKTCVISGPPKKLGVARKMVEHVVGTTMNIVEVNLTIPQPAVQRVFGKQSLEQISMMLEVNCDLMHTRTSSTDRQILKISGYYGNVEKVHDVILEYMYLITKDECNDDTLIDYVRRLQNDIQHEGPHRPTNPQMSVNDDHLRETITAQILQRVTQQLAEQQQMGLSVPHDEDIQKHVMEEVAAQMAEIRHQESMRDGTPEIPRRRLSRFEPEHHEVQPHRIDIQERDRQRQGVQGMSRIEEELERRQHQALERARQERAKLEKAKQESEEREKREKERHERDRKEGEEREKRERKEREERDKRQRIEREEMEKREVVERIRRTNLEYREWEEKRLLGQAHAKVEREKQLIVEEREKLMNERRALERRHLEEQVELEHRMLNEEQKLMQERKMLEDAKRELEQKHANLEKARRDEERRSMVENSGRMWKAAPEPPSPSNQYQDYMPSPNMRNQTSYPNVSYNAAPAPPMQAQPLPVPPRMPFNVRMPGNAPYTGMSPYRPERMDAPGRPYGAPPMSQGPAPLMRNQMPQYNQYQSSQMRYPTAQATAQPMMRPSVPATSQASGMSSGRDAGIGPGMPSSQDMQKLVSARVANVLAAKRSAASGGGGNQSETEIIDMAAIIERARRLRTDQLNSGTSKQPEQRRPERRQSPVRRSPERRWSPDRSSRRARDGQRNAYPQRREQSREGIGNRNREVSQPQHTPGPVSVPMTGINDLIMNIMSNQG